MATWKDIKTTTYTAYIPTGQDTGFYNTSGSVPIKFTLQYDADSITCTSITLRFHATNTSNNYTVDEYYAYLSPNTKDNEKVLMVKERDASWPDNSTTFTLSKDAEATTFAIPTYWLVNTGHACNADTIYKDDDGYLHMKFKDAGDQKVYWYFTNNRTNFKVTESAFAAGKTLIPDIKIATRLSEGSVSISDNGDNTITVSGTNFKGGSHNNIATGYTTLTVTFNDTATSTNVTRTVGTTSEASFSFSDIAIPNVNCTSATATIVAVGALLGDRITKSSSATPVAYYTFPTPPTKIWINTGKAAQYTDDIRTSLPDIDDGVNQLTANNACKPRKKEILMWKWSGATDGGGAAPIGGFRVYIHRIAKGTSGSPATKTPDNTINLSGKTLYEITNEGKTNEALATYKSTDVSKGSNEMYGYYCDIPYVSGEANDAQFGFIPVDLGFSAGDLCYCEVFTHNTWGDGDRRYSKANATDTDYTPIIGSCNIFNGATVWVRVPKNPPTDNTLVWKEGTVYVYHNNEWKEAEGVYVRKGGQWKEST